MCLCLLTWAPDKQKMDRKEKIKTLLRLAREACAVNCVKIDCKLFSYPIELSFYWMPSKYTHWKCDDVIFLFLKGALNFHISSIRLLV